MPNIVSPKRVQRGLALVELAIVIGTVVFLLIVTIDLCRLMNVIQISANISRESASMAYRECAGDTGPKLQICLNTVRDFMLTVVGAVKPNSEIIVSLYQYDPVSATVIAASTSSITSGNQPSHFSLSGTSISGLNPNALTSQRVLAIGEVYIPYSPLTNFTNSILDINTDKYYDATVL